VYSLIQDASDLVVELGATKRLHWMLGRHPTCDVVIDDPGISRFHATIFYDGKQLVVVDHSINGTHVAHTKEELDEVVGRPLPLGTPAAPAGDETQVIDVFQRVLDSPEVDEQDPHKSVAELRIAQSRTRVSRIAGYEKHRPVDPETVAPLLAMIYSDTESQNLAAMGRHLHAGTSIVLVGRQPHLYTIRADEE
jgi:hypothetical protein